MAAQIDMAFAQTFVPTSHGIVATLDSGGKGLPVLFIHGNSLCKEVFVAQFESLSAKNHRVIAVDLPGHGASADSSTPDESYTMGGYADAVVEVLEYLDVDHVAVLGWSLGGHVALELAGRFPGVVGLMLTGAPPVATDWNQIVSAFQPHPLLQLAGKEILSRAEAEQFVSLACGSTDGYLVNAVLRTDGRARHLLMASLAAGRLSDQLSIARHFEGPVALVNGEGESFVNLAYLRQLRLGSMVEGGAVEIPLASHAPHLENPVRFNAVMHRFVARASRESRTRLRFPPAALSA